MTATLRPTFDDVHQTLVDVGRPLLRERFHARCCVAASRLTLSVLHACGHRARAVPVWAAAGNARFADAMRTGVDPERWHEFGVQWVEIDVDNQSGYGGYPAHLVVVSDRTLIDLTSEQFDRPHKLHVPKHVRMPLPDGWPDRVAGLGFDRGSVIVYRPLKEVAVDYRTAPDWRRERTDDIARVVLAAL